MATIKYFNDVTQQWEYISTGMEEALADKVDGDIRITSSNTEPANPEVGDLWVDPEDDAAEGSNGFIAKETPVGSINGTNKIFYTRLPYIGNTLQVYVNGLAQGKLITESDPDLRQFILPTAPIIGDNITVAYMFANGTTENADTVDGYHASKIAAPNTIPVLDSTGKLPAGLGGGGGGTVDPTEILQAAYPVGSIYMNASNGMNPEMLLGFGLWETFGAGRVPVSVDTNDTTFNAAGMTGGAKTVSLTGAQNGPHTHAVDPPSTSTNSTGAHTHNTYVGYLVGGGSGARVTGSQGDSRGNPTTSSGSHSHTVNIPSFTSGSSGSGSAHENMPPYVTVFMWVRIE